MKRLIAIWILLSAGLNVWQSIQIKKLDELIIWNNNVYANDSKKLSCDYLEGWSIDEEYLMQSTGLFDEKGEEIFEGDIVQFEDCYEVSDFLYINTGIIEWCQGGFHVTNRDSVLVV